MFFLTIERRSPTFGDGADGERRAIARLLRGVADVLERGDALAMTNPIDAGLGDKVLIGQFSFRGDALNRPVKILDRGSRPDVDPVEMVTTAERAAAWLAEAPKRFEVIE